MGRCRLYESVTLNPYSSAAFDYRPFLKCEAYLSYMFSLFVALTMTTVRHAPDRHPHQKWHRHRHIRQSTLIYTVWKTSQPKHVAVTNAHVHKRWVEG